MANEKALRTIFGTRHPEMADALIAHCFEVLKANEASDDYPANDERTFMRAAVAEIKPRDAVERILAVQMAATHVATIRSCRWLTNAERIDQVQAHYFGYNKLARTYAAQMEALRKHRNGGKQTATVQHLNVADGGQAIVGNVGTGEGATMTSDASPMQNGALRAQMHGAFQTLWSSMQKSRRSRLACLPYAWRWRWGSLWRVVPELQARRAVAGRGRVAAVVDDVGKAISLRLG